MSKLKIIFLDIDGVIFPYYTPKTTNRDAKSWIDSWIIMPEIAESLNMFPKDAKIVLSSSWRKGHYDNIQVILKNHGFGWIADNFIDRTGVVEIENEDGSYDFGHRKDEILDWYLDFTRLKNLSDDDVACVVLDDESAPYTCPKRENFRQVRPNSSIGITKQDMYELNSYFNDYL